MRAKGSILMIGISLILASAARADEIIYFTNGTYLKILAHQVQGDMIKVQMDGNGSMGFPARQVDKIEDGSTIVYGGAGSPVFPNQMIPGVRSEAVVGVRSQQAKDADPDSMMRKAQASRMQATELLSGHQAESNFVDGRIMSQNAPGPSGTTRIGNHLVVGSTFNGQQVPFKPQRLQLKPASTGSDQPPQNH